jgi:uncharacterized RDD family membrane protein YckC
MNRGFEPSGPVMSFVHEGAEYGARATAIVIDVAFLVTFWFLSDLIVVATLGNLLGRLGFLIDIQFFVRRAPPFLCSFPAFLLLAATYFPLFEAMASGSPGKWITGLRVLSLDGRPPPLQATLIRALYRVIDAPALILRGQAALTPPLRMRLGDQKAGTVVTAWGQGLAEGASRWQHLALASALFLVLAGLMRFLVLVPFLGMR